MKKSKNTLLWLFALLMIPVLSCKKNDDTTKVDDVVNSSEEVAKEFSLRSSDGSVVSLSDFAGKTVVLFFFGHGCPSCNAIAPSIESDIAGSFTGANGPIVLAIDTWGGSTAQVSEFKTSKGLSFPVLENGAMVAEDYGTTYDRLIIVGSDGKILFKGSQNASKDLATVVDALNEIFDVDQMPMDSSVVDTSAGVPASGLQITNFTLLNTNNESVTLSDYAGKVIVLFTFGYGCPSCKAIAPSIESELAQEFIGNDNFAILGLETWNGNLQSVIDFKTNAALTFPVLQMAGYLEEEYGTSYDRLLVIGKDGDFAFKGTNLASNDLAAVKSLVNELLLEN